MKIASAIIDDRQITDIYHTLASVSWRNMEFEFHATWLPIDKNQYVLARSGRF